MGQAKRNGTFEERKAAAIARKKAAQPAEPYKITYRPRGNIGLMAAVAMATCLAPPGGPTSGDLC